MIYKFCELLETLEKDNQHPSYIITIMTLKGGVKILYTILGKTINFDKCNSYRQIAEIIYNDPSKYFTTVKNNKLCCRKCGEEKSLVSIYNKIKYHREIDDNWYCKKMC